MALNNKETDISQSNVADVPPGIADRRSDSYRAVLCARNLGPLGLLRIFVTDLGAGSAGFALGYRISPPALLRNQGTIT